MNPADPAVDEQPVAAESKAGRTQTGSRPPNNGRGLFHTLSHPAIQVGAALLGLLGTIVTALVGLEAGRLPADGSRIWWFSLPSSWLNHPVVLDVVFYLGLGAVSIAWFLLGIGVRAGRWRIRHLWAVATTWAAPWLVAPVALSTDVYTYLGQGLVLRAGNDPYSNGPITGGISSLLQQRIAGIWLDQPSPYGPAFTGINSLVAPLARDHLTTAVVVMRILMFLGLALAAVCLPRVARHAGRNPVVATWLGVCSPLALGAVVLSAHNDALMIGLIVAALALFTRTDLRWSAPVSAAIATCAMAIKFPAAIVVALIGFAWAYRSERLGKGIARVAIAAGIAVAVTAIISVVTTLGVKWINLTAINSPTLASPSFTPLPAITRTITDFLSLFGIGEEVLPAATVLTGLQILCYLLALTLGVILLWKLPRVGLAKASGMLLTAVAICTPVLWPWYLTWPVLLLGASIRGYWRIVLVLIAGGALFLTAADGSPYDIGSIGSLIETLLVLALVYATGRWIARNLFGSRQSVTASV